MFLSLIIEKKEFFLRFVKKILSWSKVFHRSRINVVVSVILFSVSKRIKVSYLYKSKAKVSEDTLRSVTIFFFFWNRKDSSEEITVM